MAAFWVCVFAAAVVLCAIRPADPTFTFVYPNLLIFLVGVPAAWWLPPLWLRFFPAALPDRAEPLIMALPFVFDAAAAGDTRAVIQFHVSGGEPGDYWLRIAESRCETFEGVASGADLTLHTPDHVWVDIAHGRLDGAQALIEGKYRAEGDAALLAKFPEWFRAQP
jgi:hypothetical protein